VSPAAVLPEFSIPNALPALPAGFVGRHEQLDWLRSEAGQAKTRLLGLNGPPGVGKTALAVTFAHAVAASFPGAQLFIDLDDLGPSPSPGDVMAQVIWTFQTTAVLSDDPALLTRAYHDALQDHRTLLVIDSVPSHPQWAALLPPDGCLLLVGDKPLPVQATLSLEPLPEADAVRELLDMAPRIGQAAGELANLCGRLPLALRLAGAALSTSSELVTGGYLRRLMEERWAAEVVDDTLAVLAVSARLVPADAGHLWRHLAIFPSGFDALAVAAVAELKLEGVQSLLNSLLRYGLLDRDRIARRYRLPGLPREFAARLLEPSEAERARQRHATYYRDVLAAADRLAADDRAAPGEGLESGLRAFDLERGNILTGHAWAAARVDENSTATRLASEYAAVGARLLPLRLPPAQNIGWLETARSAAQRMGDRVAEGKHLDLLGRQYRHAENPRRAIAVYERQLRLARESADRIAEGDVFSRLGLAYADLGQARRALEYYRQALDIARELGNRRAEALASWNMGLSYEVLGDLPNAIAAMQFCLDFEREVDHPDAEADAAQVEDLRRRAAR
jgi:tetratricopeptide (TPR) repeat protein